MQKANTSVNEQNIFNAGTHNQTSCLKNRKRLAVILAGAVFLSACEGEKNFFSDERAPQGPQSGSDSSTAGQTTQALVERDVEDPDAFQITADGLWDGRPSLGGTWVAHADVEAPDRVIIRNNANDTFVIGALFKRERTTPGPAFQISSDAAEALGMLAGSPAQLNVTALHREEVQVAVPAPQENPALPDGLSISEETIEVVDAIEAPEAIAAVSLEPIAEAAAAVETVAADAVAIETSALDPLADVAATLDAIDASGAEALEDTAIEAATDAAALDAAATAQAEPALRRPYIQIGKFAVQEEADSAAADLNSRGLPVLLNNEGSEEQPSWRVIVGPLSTASERKAILADLRASGYRGIYTVRQ